MPSFRIIRFSFPLLLAAGVPLCAADLNVLQSTVVDSGALNFSSAAANFAQNVNGRTYQRSPMSTFKGYQYATYYDANRNVCLGRRKLPAGSWEVIRFTDYTIDSSDSHNVVALGICAADGTIHLAFDHHADPLNYRVSAVGAASDPESVAWSASLFGPVTDKLGSLPRLTSVTYPSFFNAPNGNLMLYFRFQGSGSGDGMIHEYDGTTHDWTSGMGKFIARTGSYTGAVSTNSTSRNPYINGISYGGSRLHASWGWRESAGGSQYNHDLNYAYSDDNGRTWNNSAGTQIGTTNSSFITINSPGLLVASIPQNIGLSNQYTHYAYPDGSCHVIVAHHQSGTTTTRYHHYWRNASGTWSSQALPFSGSRPKLVGDDNRELFLAYTTGSTLTIAKGTPNAAQTSWTWTDIHSQTGRTEGGEGQIDTTRWEAERILSAYGQVKPNSAGAPTALSIFDYQVSAKAILPTPLDGQSGVFRTTALSWTAGLNAVSHRVYFGTDPTAVAGASTASPEYMGQQSGTGFTPAEPLAGGTTYYWRVDEIGTGGTIHAGLLWSFTVAVPAPPSISTLPDRTTPINTPTPALEFTVSGEPDLEVVGASSNPLLIPDGNIVFGGAGANRTVTVTPAPDQTGFADITVTASDALGSADEVFRVTVLVPGAPVAHWKLDEGEGEIAADASGSGHAGTLMNGASWGTDAERGSFVSFDGEDDRILTPFTYALSSGDDFTWAWWANQQSTGTEDDKAVMIGNRYPSPGAGGDILEFIKFTPTGGEFADTGLAANVEMHAYQTIPPGGWHHYAMVKSGMSFQWYVDGEAQGAPVTINYNEDTPLPFFIGGDDNGTGRTTEHFRGYIDDVVLYDRPLPATAVANLMTGIYDPVVTLVTLGTPVEGGTPSVWSDGLAVHPGAQYLVPATGNLRGATGSSTFPGTSLTIEAGGRFQTRAIEGLSEVTTVDALFLTGGASFVAGEFAELAAGTGNNGTNVLDGTLTNSGHSRFTTYGIVSGSTVARSLRVLSLVAGTGRIQAREGSALSLSSVFIDHPANTFSGTWESAAGSNLIFGHAGAVGAGDIEVMAGASLEILGDWSASSSLAVADAPGTTVRIGPHHWRVASLQIGSTPVADGIYLPSELNSPGGTTFTGTGSITVGSFSAQQEWRFVHFGTIEDSGIAADSYDANSDGENNLLEFATGQNPHANTRASTSLGLDGGTLVFRYTRSKAALAAGVTFSVQWSDTLLPGSWSSAGVTETVDPTNPGGSEFDDIMATVPADSDRRFYRLDIIAP